MARSQTKTKEIALVSMECFFRRNLSKTWFWTFSEPGRAAGEALWSKDEAEKHFKPFKDYCRRQKIELLVIWQLQERGSWHPHCLVNRYIDVNWLRPWMLARGWGQQMKAIQARVARIAAPGGKWVFDASSYRPLCLYLMRYLTRAMSSDEVECALKKKCFSGSGSVKAGTTRFKWMPEIKAGSYLYAHGLDLFLALFGRPPTFKDIGAVIRLGVEETGWAEIDFLWEFGFPSG
jgi:hypothetical protein